MSILSTNNMAMLERSVDFLWAKQSAILDNIANAETPGYQKKVVTFEESLKDSIEGALVGENKVRNAIGAINDADIVIDVADEATRVDENGINIVEQNIELTRNAYQMQYAFDAISSDFQILRTAIRG